MLRTLDQVTVCGRCHARIPAGEALLVEETKTMGGAYETVHLHPARATCDANRAASKAARIARVDAAAAPAHRPDAAPQPNQAPSLGYAPEPGLGCYGDAERPYDRRHGGAQDVYGGDEG